MKTLILDTCGWVFATKLGLNKLLQKHFKLLIPSIIEKETKDGISKRYRDAFVRNEMIRDGVVRVIKPKKKNIESVKTQTGLKKGDLEVLALALDQKGIVYSDNPHLESGCMILNLPLITTATLIVHFFRIGELKKEHCLTLLELLEKFGYSIEPILEVKKIVEGGKNV